MGLHRLAGATQCLAIDGKYRQRPFCFVSVVIIMPDGFGRTGSDCYNLKGERYAE